MSNIQIATQWLNQIKKAVGYPDVDKLLLDDDQIKDLIVFPQLQIYFAKFPLTQEYSQPINGELELDFPDEFVFGVVDCRVVDTGMAGGAGGSFWDLAAFQAWGNNVITSKSIGTYGMKSYNPSGLGYQVDTQRQMLKSRMNQYITIKSRVDYANRKLFVYASQPGQLNVSWAKYSNNFSDVRFERCQDIVDLCQADLMLHLANSAAMLNDTSLEVSINVDYLKETANVLKEKVFETWMSIPDVILLHSV